MLTGLEAIPFPGLPGIGSSAAPELAAKTKAKLQAAEDSFNSSELLKNLKERTTQNAKK